MSVHRHPKRRETPGQPRLLTFSCHNRLPLFKNDSIKDLFAERLDATHDRHGFTLIAWVVMPEHVHLLIRPDPSGPDAPTSLGSLKTSVAKTVIARWRAMDPPPRILDRLRDDGETRFWLRGGGHDRNIYSEDELREKIRYIELNPFRRGLTTCREQWRWSSAWWRAHLPEHPLSGHAMR